MLQGRFISSFNQNLKKFTVNWDHFQRGVPLNTLCEMFLIYKKIKFQNKNVVM